MSSPPPEPDPAWVAANSTDATLDDGTRVLIRPILPEDKERLAAGLARLSPESRYLRFHHGVGHLGEDELRYLTVIDYDDHFAWGAEATDDPSHPGVGVARYIREKPGSDRAEAAVVVADEYQGRGLGKLLLANLVETAWEHGIRTFVAYVAPANSKVMRLVRSAGGAVSHDDGVVHVEIPLAEIHAGSAIRAVLRAAAAGDISVRPSPSESDPQP
ncbi:MAG: GNAT family N-acetyltransferase [Acidimicrobiia bacterium]